MSKYVCITKCFYNGRLWSEGEKLSPSGNESVPKHFKKAGTKEAKQAEKELQFDTEKIKADAAKAVSAVGHKHGRVADGTATMVKADDVVGSADELLEAAGEKKSESDDLFNE